MSAPFPPISFTVPPEDSVGNYRLLTDIFPTDTATTPYEQVTSAFENLEGQLVAQGMDFSHVVRTWLFGNNLLEWYGELNRARHDFFAARGLYERFIPASTGIGWHRDFGAKIVLGAYAIREKQSGQIERTVLASPLQCSAEIYGSSFSRAVEVTSPKWRHVIVSGTASIAPNSTVVAHVGDIDAQIDCTLRAVDAIYQSRGLSLADITGGLVYLKAEEYRTAWDDWLRAHPDFPSDRLQAVVADICRDEWLFEIESDALVLR